MAEPMLFESAPPRTAGTPLLCDRGKRDALEQAALPVAAGIASGGGVACPGRLSASDIGSGRIAHGESNKKVGDYGRLMAEPRLDLADRRPRLLHGRRKAMA